MIETLTDEERAWLNESCRDGLEHKCLRIIDAHAADRAALVAQLEAAREEERVLRADLKECRDNSATRLAYLEQANVRINELVARVHGLETDPSGVYAQVAQLQHDLEVQKGAVETLAKHRVAAELQVAELTREREQYATDRLAWLDQMAQLTRERDEALAAAEREMRSSHRVCENLLKARDAAEDRAALVSQLEAANALLGRISAWADGYGCSKRQLKELLARAPQHAEDRAALASQLEAKDEWAERLEQRVIDQCERAVRAETLLRGYRVHFSAPGDSVYARAAVKNIDAVLKAADRADCNRWHSRAAKAEFEVASLTEALAAAEERADSNAAVARDEIAAAERTSGLLLAAEARVRDLEDQLQDADDANLKAAERAEALVAQWQQTARDAQVDLAVSNTEVAKLRARVERVFELFRQEWQFSDALAEAVSRCLRG